MCNLGKGFSSELVDLRPNLASAVLSQSLRKQHVALRRILMESVLTRIPLLWDVKVLLDLIMFHISWVSLCQIEIFLLLFSCSPPGALFNQSLNRLIIMLIWSETHSGKQWNLQRPGLRLKRLLLLLWWWHCAYLHFVCAAFRHTLFT